MKASEQHLNAPWIAETRWYDGLYVSDKDEQTLCSVDNRKTMNRIALLPDLFDSLDDAQKVLKEVLIEWSNGGDYDTYIAKKRKETGKAPPDYFVEWLELLKQVAEGNNNAR